MADYEKFFRSFDEAVARFRSFDKHGTIRIISHLDADGISACAILIHILNKENRKYSISIIPQLNKEKVIEFSKEAYPYFIFTDLGSGQIGAINELLRDKQVIILDHHQTEKVSQIGDNIVHINPHLYGIDGSKEIAGAGIAYLFANALDEKNKELAHIAVVGAIGDVQEDNGFLKLNEEILQTAIRQKKIEVKRGLRLFGMQTKPLHKVLEYSTDPYIPGVSGSESGAIQFLHQIGINPKKGKEWKKVVHLNDDEMKKLVTGIVMKRLDETKPEDVLGNIYILPDEPKESPTRDCREYATLLNACGRMDKASFGIGVCLGIKRDRQKALQTLLDYKREIVAAINWFEENKTAMVQDNGFIIINAGNQISPTIIGTLASIVSKSGEIKDNTYIMSLARNLNGTTKVSLRISGRNNTEFDLRDVIKDITLRVGGEAGGHMHAAGALISTNMENSFIEAAREILSKKSIEENIAS
jgi:RecJ-like exonuclease